MKQLLGRIWFATQAVAVVGWWLLLLSRPGLRPHFAIRDAPVVALGAFAPGDILLIALESAPRLLVVPRSTRHRRSSRSVLV